MAALSIAMLAWALAKPARAQSQLQNASLDVQLFRPAMDSKGLITLNGAGVLPHLSLSFGLVLNYARRPLSLSGPAIDASSLCTPPQPCGPSRFEISNQITGTLQGALGLFRHFEFGVALPVTLWNGDADPQASTIDSAASLDAQGAGDLTLHAKARILNTSRHPLGLALIASVSLPTGESGLIGSGRTVISPALVLQRSFFKRRLQLVANVGARLYAGRVTAAVDSRRCEPSDKNDPRRNDPALWPDCGTGLSLDAQHQLTYGVGLSLAIVPRRLEAIVEAYGQLGLGASNFNSANEVVAGLKLYLARNSYFTLGAGRGLRLATSNYGYGSPDVRAFIGFIFEPAVGDRDGDGIKDDLDRCPDLAEDFDDFEDEDGCPDRDNDRDGIVDGDDRCPNEPENKNGVADHDGCPETVSADRDGDGISDEADKCPDDPEDKDGFEDKDGCPDPDNDRDGILDVDDLCPNRAEDKDGFEDKDGCPDPDNDGDGILDGDDQCKNEPETKNGYKDQDGCPDRPVRITGNGKVEALEKIYFETNRATIRPMSYPILNAVAAALSAHGGIKLIEVQGHADERGSDAFNLELTRRRALAVKRYLEGKGVAADRLRARGYGERRPLDPRHNLRAWSTNRRVEFVIIRR